MKLNNKKLFNIAVIALLLLIIAVVVSPIFFMIMTSFKSNDEIFLNNKIIPDRFTMENYTRVLTTTKFLTYTLNSVMIALIVTTATTIMASMAGYVVARNRSKNLFFKVFSNLLLFLQMFPLILMLMPLYSTFVKYNLVGSRISIIIAYSTFSLPFGIWLLSGFFENIPRDIEESGNIDGCSKFQIFIHLIVPISSPGIASAAIFTFINSWNEFMMANVFLKNDQLKTLPVGLTSFVQQFRVEWGSLMAASVMVVIPVAIFLIFTQKYIVQGLTAGAVKG